MRYVPPTPENVEAAVVGIVQVSILLLGKEKTREIIDRALGNPPKVTFKAEP